MSRREQTTCISSEAKGIDPGSLISKSFTRYLSSPPCSGEVGLIPESGSMHCPSSHCMAPRFSFELLEYCKYRISYLVRYLLLHQE